MRRAHPRIAGYADRMANCMTGPEFNFFCAAARCFTDLSKQVVIETGPKVYIADFVVRSARLVVEIDGADHAAKKRADDLRTKRLNSKGYTVIRFSNTDALDAVDYCLGVLSQWVWHLRDGNAITDEARAHLHAVKPPVRRTKK